MVDTLRSLSALQTLLADNSVGAISPQDVRDMLVSLQPPFGSLYVSTSAATTITIAGTYYKAAGTTTAVNLSSDFTMPANNRLQYNGASPRHMHIAATLSMTTAGTNDILGVALAVDDSVLTHSIIRRFVGTGSDIGSTALHGDVMLSSGSYIEVFVTNVSAAETVTLDYMYLFAMGMLV